MRPENVPALAFYPNVRDFVVHHLAVQFGDVLAGGRKGAVRPLLASKPK